MSINGTFVWHELMCKDPEAAMKFYGELFGWKFKTSDMGGVKYHEISISDGKTDRQIGGIMNMMGPDRPPSWTGYVTVDNVDAAVQRAERCGGHTHGHPMDIPGTGRFAIVGDPTGAVIAPFTYAETQPDKSDMRGKAGTFVWNDLMTNDIPAARRFYTEVFGWSARTQDMGPAGTYHLFSVDGTEVAGMAQRPPKVPVSLWMYHVGVEDVDATHAKALKLGAKQNEAPTDIPGIGRFSVINDPQGGLLSLFQGTLK